MYPPREGDLPRAELEARANEAIERSPVPVNVYFKFTCEHCGHRCMFEEPNKLYEKGECDKCGKETEVKVGGFTLHYMFGFPKDEPQEHIDNN